MSANIYKHELRIRLRSVIIWSAALAAMILFFFS
ncbi:ABC transporter permease, partial [bacterium]